MTLLEVAYRYRRPPGDPEITALKDMREVYGIWRISLHEAKDQIRVEYDVSRLSEDDVSFLLRNAGIDLVEKLPSLPPAQPLAA